VPGVLAYRGPKRNLSPSLIKTEALRQMGNRIRDRMIGKKITVNQLAVSTGIPASTLNNYITGRNMPDPARIPTIAKQLGMRSHALVLGGYDGT